MRQGGHWRLGLILYYDWLWSLTEKFPGYYFLSRSLVACRICLQGLRTFPAMSESFKILSVVSASRERAVLRRCVGMWSNWHVEALVEEIRAAYNWIWCDRGVVYLISIRSIFYYKISQSHCFLELLERSESFYSFFVREILCWFFIFYFSFTN